MANKPNKKRENTSTAPFELSNTRSWQDYFDKETTNLYCSKLEWRKRLIHTMITWATQPTSLEVLQFCTTYKIPYGTIKEWERNYPDVKEAYGEMTRLIGLNRRVGSMTKKLDGNYAYKDMHVLDKEWLEINKYHSDLKKDEDDKKASITVNYVRPDVTSAEDMKKEQQKQKE